MKLINKIEVRREKKEYSGFCFRLFQDVDNLVSEKSRNVQKIVLEMLHIVFKLNPLNRDTFFY